MRYGHQSRFPRLMHPRREAGPQSHGTPTEFAGLPTNAPPGRSPSLRMGGPWRPQERRRGCSPTSEDVPCPALPPQALRHRPRREPRLRGRTGRRPGRPGQSRHLRTLRGPGRFHRHQHRPVGAQRRSRGRSRNRPRGLRAARRRQRRHARQRRRRPAGAGRPHHRLRRRGRTGGHPRPDRHRPGRTSAVGRGLPVCLFGAAHGNRHPGRAGRSQRAVRLHDRLDADHRIGQLGRADQRSLAVQRLLAGRQLGDHRHHHGVPGQRAGAHEHLGEQRSVGDRADTRPQRGSHPG